MRKNDLGASILKGACNAETKDLAVELGELGLDAALEEGLLKEIPVLKTVIACHKTWEAIHDQLFLRKVAAFLLACPKFTEADKEKFLNENLKDSEHANRLSDWIVLILDRLDDLEKPQMVAKAFAALVRGETDLSTFRRLAAAIDIGFIEDLRALANGSRHAPGYLLPYLPNLVRTNLVLVGEKPNPDAYLEGDYRIELKVSPLGEIFVNCMKDE